MRIRTFAALLPVVASCLGAGCATGGLDTDPELLEVPANCGITGARLVRDRTDRATVRLALPIEAEQPSETQLGCVSDWARERGMTLVFVPGLTR